MSRDLIVLIGALSVGTLHAQAPYRDVGESRFQRMVRASEAEQRSYLDLRISQGFRPVDDDALGAIVGRAETFFPIIELKIEEVLRSANPKECFADPAADPTYFVDAATVLIAESGNEYAMRAIAKLVAIDEKRFGPLVSTVVANAQVRGNPFSVAYVGLDIGDPRVDHEILDWIELLLGDKIEPPDLQWRRLWAEASVRRYGDVPLEVKWSEDPIASRINPEIAERVRVDVWRFALEVRQQRKK